MNKFVKGAKNLAFALSFVTVAACGNVKKADLDALKSELDKKVDAANCVAKDEIRDFVTNGMVNEMIDSLKKEVVSLELLENCKDKEVLAKLFGNESLKFKVFEGFDYKLIFNVDGKNFALDVNVGGKKDGNLSVGDAAFSVVEEKEGFVICKNLGFGGKCFVRDGKTSLGVKGVKDGNFVLNGDVDVTFENFVGILNKAKELGVDVKGLFKTENFKGNKFFNVDLSQKDNKGIKGVVDLIADVDDKNKPICVLDNKHLKFTFGGEEFDVAVQS